MKCTDKEWQHCRVEKMGCPGCYYYEIEVGDYVRTIYGKIDRVTEIIIDKFHTKYYGKEIVKGLNETIGNEKDIVKHSKNIIDLIEPGDYVNGHKINNITNDEYEVYGDDDWVTKKGIHLECGDEEGCIIIESDNIKSIVTKEQFKQVEFEIKEEEKCFN